MDTLHPTTESKPQVSDFTQEIETYKRDGVVVIKNVLSPAEVKACRDAYHNDLRKYGVNYNNLKSPSTHEALKKLQIHGSGGIPFYFCQWQLQYCHTNARYVEAQKALFAATWASGTEQHFQNPFAPFSATKIFSITDSCSFRLPSNVQDFQQTVGLHVDINPWDRYSGRRASKRWRPVQGFVSLTSNVGGFQCIPGFHKKFDAYFDQVEKPENHKQAFYAFKHSMHDGLHKQVVPVEYEAGDAVIWDWRLPHRTEETHPGDDTREVVYSTFVADIPLNKEYILEQRKSFVGGKYPPDVFNWWERGAAPGWKRESIKMLSPLGRQLLGFDD